jgi:hypothetical protein
MDNGGITVEDSSGRIAGATNCLCLKSGLYLRQVDSACTASLLLVIIQELRSYITLPVKRWKPDISKNFIFKARLFFGYLPERIRYVPTRGICLYSRNNLKRQQIAF